MPKPEWKDDGRRCQACNGTSRAEPLFRYTTTADGVPPIDLDMHPTCVGSFLSRNPTAAMRFLTGVR